MLIHINIGSNQNKEKNIKEALNLLKKKFKNIKLSKIYQSKAAGFKGNDFYNIGVNITTNLDKEKIITYIRHIEDHLGRDRSKPKFSSRNIDLDLILYGNEIDKKLNIPRDDILKYDFVLAPLCDLMPNAIHPILKKSYKQLWKDCKITNSLKSFNITILHQ